MLVRVGRLLSRTARRVAVALGFGVLLSGDQNGGVACSGDQAGAREALSGDVRSD